MFHGLVVFIIMKIVISESQYKKLVEDKEEPKILRIPSLKLFSNDWLLLQKFLEGRGNPPYSIGGDLVLFQTTIKSLGNLQSVGGSLDLRETPIKSLENLVSVGRDLDLNLSSIRKLSDLKYVGGDIDLSSTPLGEFLKEQLPHEVLKEFRKYIDVQGNVFYRS